MAKLLPTKEVLHPSGLHRIVIDDFLFEKLWEIRKKNRLYDRQAAIYWLLKECGQMKAEE